MPTTCAVSASLDLMLMLVIPLKKKTFYPAYTMRYRVFHSIFKSTRLVRRKKKLSSVKIHKWIGQQAYIGLFLKMFDMLKDH